jgi:hypothetical protein
MTWRRKRKTGSKVVQKEVARRRSQIIERTASISPRDAKQAQSRQIVFAVLAVIILVIAVYMVAFSEIFQWRQIIVVGTTNVSDNRIEEVMEKVGQGKIWGWLPRRNLLFFNIREAKTELLNEISQIGGVEIKRQLPNILKVYIEERDPVIIWETAGRRFYLDVDGVVSKDIVGEPEICLPTIKDLSNRSVVPREPVVSHNFVEFIKELVDTFHKETGLDAAEIVTPSPLSREVHIATADGWMLYFTSTRTLSSQYKKLLLILNKELTAEQRLNLEYIDLRIPDKIYYK